MFQAQASQRVARRKMQDSGRKAKEESKSKEASRTQLIALTEIVKKAQSEKAKAKNALSNVSQEVERKSEEVMELERDLEMSRYEIARLNKRCEQLEGRLIHSSTQMVQPYPPTRQTASPPRTPSAASSRRTTSLSQRTRLAYSA